MRFDRRQQLVVESTGNGALTGGSDRHTFFHRRARSLRGRSDGFRGDLVGQNRARASIKIVCLRSRARNEEERETRDQQAG